jgi:uncharacterized protein YdhG (YjbR/CyaY superfamily)
MSAKTRTQKSAKSTTPSGKKSKGLSAEERAALKARVRELKAEERRGKNKAAGERDVVEAIAAMGPDRATGERLHAIIKASAPGLSPKTWYGMPAYANEDGKVVCFFRGSQKFNERYMTFGFNPEANIDEGHLWPVAYALTELTAAEEKKITALVKKAVR